MRINHLPLYGVLLHLDDTLLSNGLDYSIRIHPSAIRTEAKATPRSKRCYPNQIAWW